MPRTHNHGLLHVSGQRRHNQGRIRANPALTPSAFTFEDVSNADPATEYYTSNTVTIFGLPDGEYALVTISGGQYSKNGASFINTVGYARNGDTFALKLETSEEYSTATDATLTIGTASDTFTVTTMADPAAERAVVVILTGQSLNVARGTKVLTSGWAEAKMPVDAVTVSEFDFYATNNEHTTNWDSVASAVTLAEGTGQSPAVGVALGLAGGYFSKAYIMSVAVGARTLGVLQGGGPRANLHAAVLWGVRSAIADGYEPENIDFAFYSAHGEADAAAAATENDYYTYAMDYYQMCQLYAAQALGIPSYNAPVILTYPIQQKSSAANTGEDDRTIKKAIKRVTEDLINGIDGGALYGWTAETDRVHPTPAGYVLRGEFIGHVINDFFESGTVGGYAPKITRVTLSGTTFVATFSAPITRDVSLNTGQNLNTANAEDGLEWIDNGTNRAISSLTYGTDTITGTVTGVTGTLAQQVLRIAEQYTVNTLTSGHNNLSGSVVRRTVGSFVSDYDASTNYRWVIPQSFTSVEAA